MSEQKSKEILRLTNTVRGTFLHESEVDYIDNTRQTLLTISSDRLELRARDFEENIKKRSGWIESIGLALSTFAALVTSNFHDVFGVPAESIQTCFLIICIISLCLSAYKFGNRFRKKENQAYTPAEFVELCKKRVQAEKKK